jgi:hypothetical protein
MNTSPLKSKAYYFTAALLATIAVCPLLAIYLSVGIISDNTMEKLIVNWFFPVIVLILAIAVPSYLTIASAKKNKQDKLEHYAVTILCYVIGYIMLFYGADKLIDKQFVVFYKGLDTKLSDVDSYTLTWFFYGRSNVQVFIMGLLETLPALLLLFRKTRFIGAVAMLPVILNVLVTNIFNRISPFTLSVTFLLSIFNLFIIYSYKNEIRELIRKINISRNFETPNPRWRKIRTSLKILFWGYTILLLGVKISSYYRSRGNLLYGNGAYELTALKINNKPINLDSIPETWFRKIYKERDGRYTSIINGKGDEQRADILFYPKRDSIKIAPVHYTQLDNTEEDTSTLFKGSFQLTATNELLLKGKQNNNVVEATYKKLPFKDYNWWW